MHRALSITLAPSLQKVASLVHGREKEKLDVHPGALSLASSGGGGKGGQR